VPRNQLIANAGLYHVARELSRLGWNVMLTVRNARGTDLYAVSDNETTIHAIQSKALSKLDNVRLGPKLETLQSPWWVITINASGTSPTCFVMTLDEVKSAARRSKADEGGGPYWLPPKTYALDSYKEAWERLGSPLGSAGEIAL
jgi:hypothetical protein